MTSRFELPFGGWAELRDPEQVPERLRRPIKAISMRMAQYDLDGMGSLDAGASDAEKAAAAKSVDPQLLQALDELNDATCVALIAGWSYGEPGQPVTVGALLDLPGAVYEALRVECSKHVMALMPSFEPSPDADSPTVPSGVSASS